jgi:polyphosphate kinase
MSARRYLSAKFLATFTSNLDEFFMKRVALLRQGWTEEQHARLRQLREKLLPMLRRQAECYRKSVISELADHRILLRR